MFIFHCQVLFALFILIDYCNFLMGYKRNTVTSLLLLQTTIVILNWRVSNFEDKMSRIVSAASRYCVVYVTVPSEIVGKDIARKIVQKKLVCICIITSDYNTFLFLHLGCVREHRK